MFARLGVVFLGVASEAGIRPYVNDRFLLLTKNTAMRKIFLLLACWSLATCCFCQGTLDITYPKEYYLKKSKSQKTTGWVLLASGTALSMAGLLLDNGEDGRGDYDGFSPRFKNSLSLFGSGVVTNLLSIPFFASSARNARTAATISINEQKIAFVHHQGLKIRTQPSVTLRIPL